MARRFRIRRWPGVLLGLLALAFTGFFLLRGPLLRMQLERMRARLLRSGLEMDYAAPQWEGLLSVRLDSVLLRRGAVRLLTCTGVQVQVSPACLWAEAPLTALAAAAVRVKLPAGSMGRALHRVSRHTAAPQLRLQRLAAGLCMLNRLPAAINLPRIEIQPPQGSIWAGAAQRTGSRWSLSLQQDTGRVVVRGCLLPGLWAADVQARGLSQASPLCADALQVMLTYGRPGQSAPLRVQARMRGLQVQHAAISPRTLHIPQVSADLRVQPGPGGGIVPGSRVMLGAARVEGSLDWGTHPADPWRACLHLPRQEVSALLASLPRAGFPALRSLDIRGSLAGTLHVELNPAQRSILSLRGELAPQHLQVVHDPCLQISTLGGDLPVQRPVRAPLLRAALLLAEDPGFRDHSGVDLAGLRLALEENWKAGRFLRGGGTLTMQTVRNRWLGRDKFLCRKAEEIALAWLIGAHDRVPREQILDWYLAHAEWGPGLRGAVAAAAFFFGRSPDALNSTETLFLVSILPNPRQYASLIPQGRPGPYLDFLLQGLRFQLWEQGLLPDADLDAPPPLRLRPGLKAISL